MMEAKDSKEVLVNKKYSFNPSVVQYIYYFMIPVKRLFEFSIGV